MMLAACLDTPSNRQEWDMWAFHSRMQIDDIRNAIQATYGVNLTQYVLYPFSPTNEWLIANSLAHSDFTSTLGIGSHDLTTLDFNDSDEVAAWVDLAYNELFDASNQLGIA